MKLVIGVDADGVLTDMSAWNIREGKKFFKKDPVNPKGYGPCDIFGVSKKDEFIFGLFNLDNYCSEEPPRVGAVEVLNKLKNEGHELHEITARKFTTFNNALGSHYRKLFENWLKQHFSGVFKSIQYCSEVDSPTDKLIACSKLGVNVMIEDKPEVAIHLANNGIKVLLVDAPYNQELEHPNMIRVKNWYQVYEQIKLLENTLDINIEDDFQKKDKETIEGMTDKEKEDYFYNYRKYLKNIQINEEQINKGKNRYKLLYFPAKLVTKIIFNPRIKNIENIPYQDGFIIASNHLNSYDQYLIASALGNRNIVGYAASTIKDTFRGKLFKLTESAIFVDRQDKDSKKEASEELATRIAHGDVALIFPEGTRKNKDEEGKQKFMLNFKLGTVAAAQKTGAAILPVAIDYGKENVVNFGKPFIVKATDDLEEANQKLFDEVSRLKQEILDEKEMNNSKGRSR